jgi:hypothetical protein
MESIKDKKTIITVNDYKHNSSLQLTLNWDANLEEWKQAFKTILIHQTFDEDTVKELFEEKELYFTKDYE